MRNSVTRTTKTGPDNAEIFPMFNKTRLDERKSCAFGVSMPMKALVIHMLKEDMNGVETAELLHREVARYEVESRGDWF